jgi:hypothetical protein
VGNSLQSSPNGMFDREIMVGMFSDKERIVQRLSWLIAYLEQHGSPKDPPGKRKPLTKTEIARRLCRGQGDVSKLRNPDGSGRKGVGAEIVVQVARGFGISPLIFTDDFEGEPDITLYILKEKRQGREIDNLDSKVDRLLETVDRMAGVIDGQQRRIEALERHESAPRQARKAQ